MKHKTQKYLKKFSIPAAIVLLSFFTFISCSKDIDDTIIDEQVASELSKSVYFYGSDTEFEELDYSDMKLITSEDELAHISKTEGNSYLLFVGKDINVREGLVDNIRNSGILVTQLKGKSKEKKALPALAALIKEEKSDAKSMSGVEEKSYDNFLHCVSYLSINGEHKILAGIYESMKHAEMKVLEWSEKKEKESRNIISKTSAQGAIVDVKNLSIEIAWPTHGDFSVDSEIDRADTDGYMIGNVEYPDTFIYDHRFISLPKNGASVINVQVLQWPIYNGSTNDVNLDLRNFLPENNDNGVLNGDTGSDTWGYGVNGGWGFDLSGPSVNLGGSLDWSHTTDWSIPACDVITHHNPVSDLYHVVYRINPNGSWSQSSVLAKGYTNYSTNAANVPGYGYAGARHHAPSIYFTHMLTDYGVKKDLYVYLESSGLADIRMYHNGYFNDPENFSRLDGIEIW